MGVDTYAWNRKNKSHYLWTVRVQGNLSRVYRQRIYNTIRPKKKRGKIYGFSAKTRMRMLRESAKIDWNGIGQSSFVTLTYPDWCVEEHYKQRTVHRFVFHRYLEKYFGCYVPTIWRVEWKPRQSGMYEGLLMPHIHYVIIGLPALPKETIRSLWQRTLSYDEYVDVDSKDIYGAEGAAKYISKYVSKPDALGIVPYVNKRVQPGKAWSINRSSSIKRHPITVCRMLTDDEVAEVQQLAVLKMPNYDPTRDGGFTLFGEDTAKIIGYWYGNSLATEQTSP